MDRFPVRVDGDVVGKDRDRYFPEVCGFGGSKRGSDPLNV